MQIYDAKPKIKENTLKGILFVSSKFNKRAFEPIIRFGAVRNRLDIYMHQ